MSRGKKRTIAILLMISMMFGFIPIGSSDIAAKKKVKLSKTKLTIQVGKTKTLKLKNVSSKRKLKWSSTDKKIASVKKITKRKARITAKKAGKVKIKVKVKKTKKYKAKTYKCTLTVKKKQVITATTVPQITPAPTVSASPTPTPAATQTPTLTPTATPEPTIGVAYLVVGGDVFDITIYDNAISRMIVQALPFTVAAIDMDGYAKLGKSSLSFDDTEDRESLTAGDLMAYGDSNLILCYGQRDEDYFYTKIGHVADTERLAAIMPDGQVTFTITTTLPTSYAPSETPLASDAAGSSALPASTAAMPSYTPSSSPSATPISTSSVATPIPTFDIRKQDTTEVSALQNIISSQNKQGAKMPSDLGERTSYIWENGHLTDLVCNDMGLGDTLSLVSFPYLKRVECQMNHIQALNISKNTALETLDCSYNQISTLNLSTCLKLSVLRCAENLLTASGIDISVATALEEIDISYNNLNYLDTQKNTKLRILHCEYNLIGDLYLPKNTELTHLYCEGNKVGMLDLTENLKLVYLRCAGTVVLKGYSGSVDYINE